MVGTSGAAEVFLRGKNGRSDPVSYLGDVLRRLPSMTNQDDLTPLIALTS